MERTIWWFWSTTGSCSIRKSDGRPCNDEDETGFHDFLGFMGPLRLRKLLEVGADGDQELFYPAFVQVLIGPHVEHRADGAVVVVHTRVDQDRDTGMVSPQKLYQGEPALTPEVQIQNDQAKIGVGFSSHFHSLGCVTSPQHVIASLL